MAKIFYRLVIAYDGTDFSGWQSQKNGTTVAEALEHAFGIVFHLPVQIHGTSRTDAGVHARGQVACAWTDLDIDADKLHRAWSAVLPDSIVIKDIQKFSEPFQLHKDIDEKIYYYHFFTERPDPFMSRYGWFYFRPNLDMEKLQRSLDRFVGTHDFRSFCTGDCWEDTVRTVNSIKLVYLSQFGAYRIIVKGKKFLHHMVRRLVGAALYVASDKKLDVGVIDRALQEKNPQQALPTAPAKGLMLYKIKYKNNVEGKQDETKFLF